MAIFTSTLWWCDYLHEIRLPHRTESGGFSGVVTIVVVSTVCQLTYPNPVTLDGLLPVDSRFWSPGFLCSAQCGIGVPRSLIRPSMRWRKGWCECGVSYLATWLLHHIYNVVEVGYVLGATTSLEAVPGISKGVHPMIYFCCNKSCFWWQFGFMILSGLTEGLGESGHPQSLRMLPGLNARFCQENIGHNSRIVWAPWNLLRWLFLCHGRCRWPFPVKTWHHCVCDTELVVPIRAYSAVWHVTHMPLSACLVFLCRQHCTGDGGVGRYHPHPRRRHLDMLVSLSRCYSVCRWTVRWRLCGLCRGVAQRWDARCWGWCWLFPCVAIVVAGWVMWWVSGCCSTLRRTVLGLVLVFPLRRDCCCWMSDVVGVGVLLNAETHGAGVGVGFPPASRLLLLDEWCGGCRGVAQRWDARCWGWCWFSPCVAIVVAGWVMWWVSGCCSTLRRTVLGLVLAFPLRRDCCCWMSDVVGVGVLLNAETHGAGVGVGFSPASRLLLLDEWCGGCRGVAQRWDARCWGWFFPCVAIVVAGWVMWWVSGCCSTLRRTVLGLVLVFPLRRDCCCWMSDVVGVLFMTGVGEGAFNELSGCSVPALQRWFFHHIS